MADGNPVYTDVPELPPGLAAIPYVFGDLYASAFGGVAGPYVPENQSTYDAAVAKRIVNPLYKATLSDTYGQLFYQLGNTVGASRITPTVARLAGYTPEQIQSGLRNGAEAFGRSQIGSLVAPIADRMFDALGITGGSFIAMNDAVFANRLNLLSQGPGSLFSPYDREQAMQGAEATSAMMGLLTNMISQKDPKTGKPMLTPDMAVTQGFDRKQIADIAMALARGGALSGLQEETLGFDQYGAKTGSGFYDRMARAVGEGVDLSELSAAAGDFSGGGEGSRLTGEQAKRVKAISDEVSRRVQDGIDAVGALRDFLKTTDGLIEKMTALTNGRWVKSSAGAREARDAIRTLNAVAQVYNLDPNEAYSRIFQNRGALQDAAGFDGSMRFFGFDGGGMFGLSAQTALLAHTEDMITSRGLRGDPVAAERLRKQSVQAMARNENMVAGRGAQLLAYARQVGIVSDEAANEYRQDLQSGDRAVMGDALNRLLVTMFGSSKIGRERMNNQTFMNGIRMRMNDEAGAYAMNTIIRGADTEYLRQEKVTAATERMNFSRTALSEAGLRTRQTEEGVGRIVESVATTLQGLGAEEYATSFREQVAKLQEGGMKPQAALNAVMSSFSRSPATARFAEQMKLAVTRQTAANNEAAYAEVGLESRQAMDLLKAIAPIKAIDGKQRSVIRSLIREGRGADALAQIDSVISGLSPAQQKMYNDVKDESKRKHEVAVRTMEDRRAVDALVSRASESGYGSQAVVDSYNEALAAAQAYIKTGDFGDFWETFSNSRFGEIFGKDGQKEFLDAVKAKDTEYFKKMGRRSFNLSQVAARNLTNNGYDLHYSGYWGHGLYSGNSKELADRRNKLVSDMAEAFNVDSKLSAGDRTTFAQDLVALVTDDKKDWKSLIKVYDKSGKLESALKGYSVAFDDYMKANTAYKETKKGYGDVLKGLTEKGEYATVDYIKTMAKEIAKGNDALTDDEIISQLSANNLSSKDIETVSKSLSALRTVHQKQVASESELKKAAGDKDAATGLRLLKAEQEYDAKSGKQVAKRLSFLDDVDVSKLAKYTGSALDKAYASIRSVVSDDEVAERLKVASLKDVKDGNIIRAKRLEMYREKVEAGDSRALAQVGRFDAARREETALQIKGEITLKNGNDQSPALLSGNVGGL